MEMSHEHDPLMEFNFWTAFADMMLALVLVLCMLLFVITVVISLGTVNLKQVVANQSIMVNAIANDYHTRPYPLDPKTFGISTAGNGVFDIEIKNDLNSQRLTFSDKLLFQADRTDISELGKGVLNSVGRVLLNQTGVLKEIQIQGHADTLQSNRFRNNTVLASERAIAVLEYLSDPKHVGLDRSKILMSATSFGEFKPLKRDEEGTQYSSDRLKEDNLTELLRGRNRRIELVLIYHR